VARNIHDAQKVTQQAAQGNKMSTWSISSSSGREQLVISSARCANITADSPIVCSVNLAGETWQRSLRPAMGQVLQDFSLTVPEVLIRRAAILELLDNLNSWQLTLHQFEIELADSCATDQSFVFELSRVNELIFKQDRPACTIRYSTGVAITTRSSFVVDQSCIALCAESLSSFVARLP
jgi:hypothetical protein